MKTYLVGGAVRDRLLNRNVQDRDWVVVGGSTKEMLSLGFTQVGKDFPVFLHPKTREEYALARTERKTGSGYGGFVVDTDINVTLEEDLARRDLTINAMASDEGGTIIDPFGGVNDIKNLRLRHVTAAFAEDPLRVLRVARFKARFHHLGFIIDPETRELMTGIANSGELADLVVERIWIELNKSLLENTPSQFFLTLRDCGALNVLFPEIDSLFGVVQPKEHHPEIDTGIHTMMVLDQAAAMQADATVRFAALVHDLGKADTAPDMLPKHIGHEDKSVKRVNQLCSRLKTPKSYHELAVIVAKYHTLCHQALNLKAGTVLKLLESVDAFRRPYRLNQFLQACKSDALGRKGKERDGYEQERYLVEAFQACSSINVQQIIEAGAQGAEISAVLKRKRCQAIAVMKSDFVIP